MKMSRTARGERMRNGGDAGAGAGREETRRRLIVILTPSVEVKDISLTDYINVSHAVYVREWRTAPRSRV